MSNYVKATDFAAKDSLVSGDPNKIVKGTEINTEFSNIQTAISSKADTNSPTLTGTPLTPTAVAGTNTTQIASTAFVHAERTNTATLTNKTLTSPTINTPTISGGSVTGITDLAVADGGTGSSTAAGARTNLGLVIGTDVAPVASPAFTGVPTVPTATAGTNTTQVASTAFVTTAVTNATGSLGTMSTQNSNNVTITGGTIAATFTGNLTGNASTATSATTASSATTATTANNVNGVGQSWQNVTGSRSLGSTYTNSTGRPITVMVSMRGQGSSAAIAYVNGVEIGRTNAPDCCGVPQYPTVPFSFIVPAGHTYKCTGSGLSTWAELR